MKKIFALLLCVFITVAVFAASQTPVYVDTEQKYVFSVDNLSQTIPEFVEDTAKQDAMASKYLELANKETGAVSVKDLFDICEAGGFKTRRAEGYESCRNFVVKLLETVEQELEDGTLTGYCPGLDENGKNPNRLKSITGETKVGDFCSSSNIAAGEVVFKKGYNCTCAAYACNNCCESIGGACLTKVADGNGNCLRKEYDNVPNLNVEGAALKFCESKAQRGCKVFSALRNYPSPGKVVCNGTEEERSAVRALSTPCPDTAYAFTNENNTLEKCRSFCIGKAKENSCKSVNVVHNPVKNECICNPDKETVRRLNMKYYQVCGKDKGKSGGSIEECLRVFTNKVYGGIQVTLNHGILLAKEWARKNGYREIECDTKIYDYSSLDDSILCSSIDKDKNGKRGYFEFVFDDLKESSDTTIEDSFYYALFTKIYGYTITNSMGPTFDTKSESNCTKMNEVLKRFCGGGASCRVEWVYPTSVQKGNKYCKVMHTALNGDGFTAKTSPKDFHNPFEIDPFVFCKSAQTQLQNNSSIDVLLRQYISNASNYPMSKIECYPQTFFYCGGGCKCVKGGINDYRDDIKRCVVHGDKDYYVEFVFDDITEFSKKREKGALQSMGCVVSGGTFNGQECKFANKSQCDTYIKSMSNVCPQCTKPKWNPDTGLCEVPDAAAVTAMEKHEKTAMIIGGVVVSVVVTVATAGSGAPVIAIVLSGVEVAGGAMEYFAQQHIDGMAHDFFLKSAKCNNASCAEKMISENMQEMANIQNDLEDYEINALDAEFERLLGLIEPSSDFYMRIAEKGTSLQDNQKGFFDPDSWNQAQVWRAIGIGLQFVSLGTGVITKIIQGPKFANKFPKMQAMLLKQVKISKKIKDTKKVTSAVEMSAGQAKRLDELDGKIATLESKTNRSAAEADELKKLRQERNELKNKIGTKDADELAKMQKEAFNQKDIQKAQEDYDKIMERRNSVAEYMAAHNGNPPKGTSKQVIREINENVSKAENKLKELGQEVTPMEPLEIGKKPAVKPVEGADAGKAADKADNVADADKGANNVSNKIRSDAELRNAVDEVFDNHLKEFKNSGKSKTFEKSALSDDEWVALNKSLEKDNVKLVEKMDGVMAFERTDDVADAGKAVGKADDVAGAGKGVNKAQNSNMSSIEEIENSLGSNYKNLKRELKTNPDRTLVFDKNSLTDEEWKALNESLTKENLEVVSSGESMFVRQKRVFPDAISDIRNRAYSEFNAHADNIKKGVEKELNIPKSHLSDDEWKVLEADLNKEGLEITEANDHYFRVKKSTKANPVSNVANKTDNVADAGKGVKPTKTAGKWANAAVPDPAFDIKVTPLELGGKKYYLKSGDTESLIQNEISRTKQAHKLLKHNKIVTSVDVVEDNQTILKAFMDDHPEITLPRTPDTQYFIMDATHVNTVEGLSDAEILGYLRNKPITIKEQNTILSELQNMNNNGLIHNDIGHNFAIYRDSGGKLHMELMDFGDFTSEQKLLRSNDDVLEIKKLFSKWSDKGLVEKTATPKVTANTASKTADQAVSKVDNVASGAKNAEKNVNSVVKKSYKDFNWEYKSATESNLGYSHRRVNLSDLTPNEINFLKNDLTKQGISFEITSTNKGNLLIVRDGAEVSRSASSVSKAAAVIETPVEEANKLFNIYGLSLENINGLEIPMSRFGNGEKTVNELARLVEKKGGYLQQIGDKIVVRKPGKTGWDLRQSLKEHGIISNRYASDAFHEIHIRSGDQCVSGLKFHVSVNVEDLENASYIVDDLVRRTDVADIWKVYSDGMTGTQKGKDFTIYVSQNGYNSDKIQGFLQELENELKARNIRPNGYGNNIVTGDKPVSGSNYMYYRYDRINASGIPDGEYNSSYNFIAPNAQYGGDIMNGIKVGF